MAFSQRYQAYWSAPRGKGSKARIDDVYYLYIPNYRKGNQIIKRWVRCEVNEWVASRQSVRIPDRD